MWKLQNVDEIKPSKDQILVIGVDCMVIMRCAGIKLRNDNENLIKRKLKYLQQFFEAKRQEKKWHSELDRKNIEKKEIDNTK